MKKQTRLTFGAFLFAAFLAAMTGCSSSPTEDGELGEDVPALEGEEAASDALPEDAELASADEEFKEEIPTEGQPPEGDPLADLDAPQDNLDAVPAAAPTPAADALAAAVAPPGAEPTPAAPPAMTEPTAVVAQPIESSPLPPMPESGAGSESYTVQRGDTLMKVAFEQYGDLYKWRELYENNRDKIPNPNRLDPGITLAINRQGPPPQISRNGEQYMIRRGDTLGTISQDVYGTSSKWRKIWDNNRELIRDPNKIYAGFYLYYTQTPQERDAADQMRQQPVTDQQPLADAGGAPPEAAPAAPATDERTPASEAQ